MEKRKTQEADLERRRLIFLQLGFAIALSATLIAFQYTTFQSQNLTAAVGKYSDDFLVEEALVYVPKAPAKPQPVQKVLPTNQFELKDDDFKNEVGDEKKPLLVIDDDFNMDDFGGGDEVFDDLDLETNKPQIRVEIMPYFLDCENVLDREMQEMCTNQRIITEVSTIARYPAQLQGTGIDGTVYVSFIVNEKGEVSKAKVERGVHRLLDKEAIRAVEALPLFQAGVQQGKKVKVIYNIPVKFVVK